MHLEEGSCFELARGNVFSPIQPGEDFMIKTALLHSSGRLQARTRLFCSALGSSLGSDLTEGYCPSLKALNTLDQPLYAEHFQPCLSVASHNRSGAGAGGLGLLGSKREAEPELGSGSCSGAHPSVITRIVQRRRDKASPGKYRARGRQAVWWCCRGTQALTAGGTWLMLEHVAAEELCSFLEPPRSTASNQDSVISFRSPLSQAAVRNLPCSKPFRSRTKGQKIFEFGGDGNKLKSEETKGD